MCFNCGRWPWGPPDAQLAADPIDKRYIYLDDNVEWYPDTRTVSNSVNADRIGLEFCLVQPQLPLALDLDLDFTSSSLLLLTNLSSYIPFHITQSPIRTGFDPRLSFF